MYSKNRRNTMSEKVVRIIDLTKAGKSLFTGTDSGKKVADKSDVRGLVRLEIKSDKKLLVTSSFFSGLLSKVDMKNSEVHYIGLSDQSKCELKRALKGL
ncbi:hypothetical protein LAh8_41 [Aeromonas phage LAh_8]|uniref:Uncharacterized protein n=1 Tax=Aeromonas phage LAh_8 TaxID=2591032 RepID=A0A514A0L4_9CAUD|nr:hypothetical protein HWC31_gp041 [Aeromonas phage LAh_8]QDH46809.1 hypothetical protein LAh8_41 [Aeromonas phage LAh_8]